MPAITKGTMSHTEIGVNDDWGTPQRMYDALDAEFHFDIDVCANESNHKHRDYFSIEQDGLKQDWTGKTCWMNPPYGRSIGRWIRKATETAEGGGDRCRSSTVQDGYKVVG